MKLHSTQTSGMLVLTGLAIAVLMAGCGAGDDQKKPAVAGVAPPPPEVDVVTIKPGRVILTNDLPGRLQAYRTAQVRARVEGIVEKRLFTEGSEVKEGAPLYQIYVGNYRTSHEAAKTDLEVARQNLARAKQLLEGKFITQQDYDSINAKLKQAEAAYSKAREDWDNTRVPAPISGRIGRTMVTEGALVGRGEPTLLTTIEQINPLYANFTEAGADLLRLQQAMMAGSLKHAQSTKIELVLEDGSIYPLPGKLFFTDMAADPSTGSVSMRAEIPNPKHELLPGMFVTVRFPEALADNAIKVPQRAVQMTTQGQFVMVVDTDGNAAPRPIKTGDMSGGDFVIEEGLKPGDQVIVNGLQKVRPGSPVKSVQWNPQESSPAVETPATTEKK